MNLFGTLYGVGVGPGAPDLLTVRALRVIEQADVLALPRSSDRGTSVAWSIAAPAVTKRSDQERLHLTFPMSKDPAVVRPRLDAAVDAIGERLRQGKSVAFLTEGDPSVYSTFGYVRGEALSRWPDLRVEIVPGVSSITAVAAAGGVPLSDGHERIAIVPATYGVDDLVDLLARFDTVVLTKLGGALPAIREALARTGLTGQAFVVSRATMEGERVERDVGSGDYGGCFSTMIVKRQDRAGALIRRDVPDARAGEAP